MRSEQPKVARSNQPAGNLIRRYGGEAIVVALAILLWLPRLSGPIDLRWDAGVYYILGTSLATGHGYRILSEPGSPKALQYPPLLPFIVAAHQSVLNTTNPDIVGPLLRKSYAVMFVAYALACLSLARRYLTPRFAVLAVTLCLLQVCTIYLSDLLFTELPFALIGVGFALANGSSFSGPRTSLQDVVSFLLAGAGFLLRTAGLALLGVWVLEACLQRRWLASLARAAVALIPVLAWQLHIQMVHHSYEYTHPAYEYQRASYLYYNVSYAENAKLTDPSRPEKGVLQPSAILPRLMTNTLALGLAIGETVSTVKYYWVQALEHFEHRLLPRLTLPSRVVLIPILLLSFFVLIGLGILVQRGALRLMLLLLVSLGLIWTTPWPLQFPRYLSPLALFVTIPACLTFACTFRWLKSLRPLWASSGRLVLSGFLLLVLLSQLAAARQIFYRRSYDGATFASDGASSPHFFYHDQSWRDWEEAIAWIAKRSRPDAIVATPAAHFCYLRTGLRAVSPPLELNADEERRLLNSVPVSYSCYRQIGVCGRISSLRASRHSKRPFGVGVGLFS